MWYVRLLINNGSVGLGSILYTITKYKCTVRVIVFFSNTFFDFHVRTEYTH